MPNRVTYVAVVENVAGRGFRAHFPDFPEVHARDETIQQLAARAGQTLGAHITKLLQAGLEVPRPTGVDDVKADGRYRNGLLLRIEVEVHESHTSIRASAMAMRHSPRKNKQRLLPTPQNEP